MNACCDLRQGGATAPKFDEANITSSRIAPLGLSFPPPGGPRDRCPPSFSMVVCFALVHLRSRHNARTAIQPRPLPRHALAHDRTVSRWPDSRHRAAFRESSMSSTWLQTMAACGRAQDYGHTWNPIFDDQPTGSVGALAVAPSNPDIIYVGSGEGLRRPDLSVGDGIYKSTDAGRTWRHLGLRDAQQIGSILVDPHDPNRVFVAALGHPYGPNDERGVYRSSDGGLSWESSLQGPEHRRDRFGIRFHQRADDIRCSVGLRAPALDHGRRVRRPRQRLVQNRSTAVRPGANPTRGSPSGADLGRIGLAIAPSDPKRMYAWVQSNKAGGIYRSDDAGDSWQRVNSEERVYGRGDDFAGVRVLLKIAIRSLSPTLPRTAPPTPGAASPPSKVLPAAMTTTPSGSIRTIRRSLRLPVTRASRSVSTTARLGVPGTTSPRRSSTMSSPTISFPTGSTGASRKVAAPGLRAAAILARLPSATGTPWVSRSTDTSLPTHSIPT